MTELIVAVAAAVVAFALGYLANHLYRQVKLNKKIGLKKDEAEVIIENARKEAEKVRVQGELKQLQTETPSHPGQHAPPPEEETKGHPEENAIQEVEPNSGYIYHTCRRRGTSEQQTEHANRFERVVAGVIPLREQKLRNVIENRGHQPSPQAHFGKANHLRPTLRGGATPTHSHPEGYDEGRHQESQWQGKTGNDVGD